MIKSYFCDTKEQGCRNLSLSKLSVLPPVFLLGQAFSPWAWAAPAATSTSPAPAGLGRCCWDWQFTCHLGEAAGSCHIEQRKWGAFGAEMSWTEKTFSWPLWSGIENISEWWTLTEYVKVPECFQYCPEMKASTICFIMLHLLLIKFLCH